MRAQKATPLDLDRYVPWVRTIRMVGLDLTGAAFRLQARLTPDAEGTPLFQLVNAAAGLQGISAALDGSDTVITLRADASTTAALPDAAEIGDGLAVAYDIWVTPAGGDTGVWWRGPLTINAGVTR